MVRPTLRSRIGHRADAFGPRGPQRPAHACRVAPVVWTSSTRSTRAGARATGSTRDAPGAAAVARRRRRAGAWRRPDAAQAGVTGRPVRRAERPGEQRRRGRTPRAPARRARAGRARARAPPASSSGAGAAAAICAAIASARASLPRELQRLHARRAGPGVGERRPRRVERPGRAPGSGAHGSGRAQRGQRGGPQPRQRAPAAARTALVRRAPPARRRRCRPAGRRRRRARRGRGAWAPHAARRRATGHARIATIDPALLAVSLRVDLRPRPDPGRRRWPAPSTSRRWLRVRRTNGPRGAGGWRLVSFLAGLAPDPRGAGLPVDSLGDQLFFMHMVAAHRAARPRADPAASSA